MTDSSMPDRDALLEQLQEAVDAGNLSQVQSRVQQLERLPERPTERELALCLTLALENDHVAIVEHLLSHGAKPDGSDGRVALEHPAWKERLQLLLDHGFDPNCQMSRQRPFADLALGADDEKLEWLLEHGADPNGESVRWRARLLDTCATTCSVETFKILLKHGARLELANPLHSAAAAEDSDRTEMLTYLLNECKLDINAVSHFGHRSNKRTGDEDGTPLQAAVKAGTRSSIVFLLGRGADPYAVSEEGDNAFEYGEKHGFEDGLQMLKEASGAKQNGVQ